MVIEISRLKNGLQIITDKMLDVESVALGIWVKVGSRHEEKNQHGIAHFLEHMVFKGTHNRSTLRIATDIEDVGGNLNAITTVETTSYFARVLGNNIPLAIDILCDILTNSKFDHEELEREKQVLLQEIGVSYDTPDDVVFDYFTRTAFQDQIIGRPILGTAKTVQFFSPEDLRLFMQKHYTADRMIFIAVGNVDHEKLIIEAEKKFSVFETKEKTFIPTKAHYTGGYFSEKRAILDTQLLLGFKGNAYHAQDFYASQILSMILGGGMSSRLFQEIRENLGLCYSIYAFHWGFSDTGLLGIYAATGEAGMKDLVSVLIRELYKAVNHIDKKELDRARTQYRAGLIMLKESPMSRANYIARQILLFGRIIPDEELYESIASIIPERLMDIAQRIFLKTSPTLAVIGSADQQSAFEEIKRNFK